MSTEGWIIAACVLLVLLFVFVVLWWREDAETQREIAYLEELAERQDRLFEEQAQERERERATGT